MRRRTLLLAAAAGLAVSIGCAATGSAGASIPCDLTLRYGSRSGAPAGQLHLDLVLADGDGAGDAPCRARRADVAARNER